MIGQHESYLSYEDAQILVEKYLIENGFSMRSVEQEDEINQLHKNSKVFNILLECMNKNITLSLVLTNEFPDTIPYVYIDKKSFSEIYPIPHLSCDRSICTFNRSFHSANIDLPIELVRDVLDHAIKTIESGIGNKNIIEEYNDEFINYWAEDADGRISSLVENDEESKEIICIRKDGISLIISDDKAKAVNWISNTGQAISKTTTNYGIYIPALNVGIPPFPKDFAGWVKRLKELNVDTDKVVKLISYLEEELRPSLVLFSHKHENGFSWAALEFQKVKKKIKKPYKDDKYYFVSNTPGFRTGKTPIELEIRYFPETIVKRYVVHPIFLKRLFERGGEGIEIQDELGVAIAGCGSIGSHICEAIVQSGTSKLLIIDPEILQYDNIGRHLCGANQVGEYKSNAISKSLGSRYPSVSFIHREMPVSKVIRKESTLINEQKLIIVSIGEFPAEFMINRYFVAGTIKIPLLFVWVEPFLAGGHAVYLSPESQGCFECLFDNNFQYKYKILAGDNKYSKRDAGCSSNYIPYGANKIRKFIAYLNDFIINVLSEPPEKSLVWTWLGNLDENRKNDRALSPMWSTSENYKIFIDEIRYKENCRCKK